MTAGSLTFDAFLARRSTDRRLARLTHDISLPAGRGLEFGAADNPTPLPNGIDIFYVDHAKDAAAALPGAIPVDYAWSGSGLLVDVLRNGHYDFAIAAQVAQYVPNLLGWLRSIHEVLRPGGVMNLSIPDKRFMFDAVRTESTFAELIEANLLAYERPSPRQLFAHSYEARNIAAKAIWDGADPWRAQRMSGDQALSHAHAVTIAALAESRYVLCHCWVFTPLSFLARLREATLLGLFPFVLNQTSETATGECEFFVSMRRDVEDDADALRQMQLSAIDHLASSLQSRRRAASLIAQ